MMTGFVAHSGNHEHEINFGHFGFGWLVKKHCPNCSRRVHACLQSACMRVRAGLLVCVLASMRAWHGLQGHGHGQTLLL